MRTYTICDGAAAIPYDIQFTTQSNCDWYQTTNGGNSEYYRRQKLLRTWINGTTTLTPPAGDIEWFYNEAYVIKRNGITIANGNNIKSIIIPAGVEEFLFYQDCEVRFWENGKADLTITTLTQTELFQPVIPICAPAPPECNLTLALASTPCTSRGSADGTITASYTSDVSTTCQYWINGYTDGIQYDVIHVFSGLTAGNYSIRIEAEETGCIMQSSISVEDGDFRSGDFITSGAGVSSDVLLVAVDNPIIVNINTTITSVSPTKSITDIVIVDDLLDGDTITFNLTSPFIYSNTFYAKSFPNKPNYFLAELLKNKSGVVVGHNTKQEVCTALAEALQNDVVIPKAYYINNANTTITLTAKETGFKFNLASNIFTSTSGITVTEIQAGTNYCDGQQTDNYSLGIEVMANTDVTNQYPDTGDYLDFNRIAELILPFSQDNQHKFDISGILKSQVSTPKPDITLTGSTYLSTVMQPYFCKVYEYYPLVANTNTIKKRYKTDTLTKWVINSSLDRYAANDMNMWLGDESNINPNFKLTFTPGTATMEFIDYTLNGGLGVTDIQFSIWDISGTTKYYGWQSNPEFIGLPMVGGNYLAIMSGTTNGVDVKYEKSFYFNNFGSGYDMTIQSNVTTDVKFLTNSPNPKQIQRNSNEFLYFVLQKDYGKALKVKGDLYFYDGTEALGQTFFDISTGTTNAGGVMCLNLSYDKLGLEAYEVSGSTNRKIKRAEIAVYQSDIANGDFQYSEMKSYRFEIDEQPRKFGVLFQNDLGMYDSFDFIGIVEELVDRQSGTYTVPLNFNNNGSIAAGTKNTATYDTKVTNKVVVNTGWINLLHFEWLKELLKSNNVYSTSSLNQNYLNIMEYKYTKSSLDDLFDCEITFLHTIYENSVTV